jgi:hypothetical protein
MAVRINLTKTAWNNFLSCSPSQKEKNSVKQELDRLRADPAAETPVPFRQWEGCDMTWAEGDRKWYIVYRRNNPDSIDVLLIDEAQ